MNALGTSAVRRGRGAPSSIRTRDSLLRSYLCLSAMAAKLLRRAKRVQLSSESRGRFGRCGCQSIGVAVRLAVSLMQRKRLEQQALGIDG